MNNTLDFVDIINVMDFILQLQNMETSQKQIDEIRGILTKQSEALDKIMGALYDQPKRD